MTKIIFEATEKPQLLLWLTKYSMEEVLNIKNIKGVTLKSMLQELLPEFSVNDIRLDIQGNVVLEDYLYNAIEFGTLTIPKFQIISKTRKRVGRRAPWQITT